MEKKGRAFLHIVAKLILLELFQLLQFWWFLFCSTIKPHILRSNRDVGAETHAAKRRRPLNLRFYGGKCVFGSIHCGCLIHSWSSQPPFSSTLIFFFGRLSAPLVLFQDDDMAANNVVCSLTMVCTQCSACCWWWNIISGIILRKWCFGHYARFAGTLWYGSIFMHIGPVEPSKYFGLYRLVVTSMAQLIIRAWNRWHSDVSHNIWKENVARFHH